MLWDLALLRHHYHPAVAAAADEVARMPLAGAVFMVKTTKRIIFSEARSHGFDGNRHNYVLLMLAGLQFPLHFWLGSV